MSSPPLPPRVPAPGPRLETHTVESGAMVSAYGQRVQEGLSVMFGNRTRRTGSAGLERSTIAISSVSQVV